MVENEKRGGIERSRLIEKAGGLVLLVLIGKYSGDIAESPGFKERLTKLTEIPRYRLFHGVISGCYIQISQGKEIINPKKVIITCIGKEESQIGSTIDDFLRETGIQEVNAPGELREVMEKVKQLAAAGVIPEWMRE